MNRPSSFEWIGVLVLVVFIGLMIIAPWATRDDEEPGEGAGREADVVAGADDGRERSEAFTEVTTPPLSARIRADRANDGRLGPNLSDPEPLGGGAAGRDPSPSPSPQASGSFVIRQGDSYSKMAKAILGRAASDAEIKALLAANPEFPPRRLQIGKAIRVPEGFGQDLPKPTGPSARGASPQGQEPGSSRPSGPPKGEPPVAREPREATRRLPRGLGFLNGGSSSRGGSEPSKAPSDQPRPSSGSGQSIVVGPGDSLWSLAQKHLGNGARWKEIQRLNQLESEHLTQGDRLQLPAR